MVIKMEKGSKEAQNLFKSLVIYHCYREQKYAKGATTALNKDYGKSFVSEGMVQKWFKTFKDKDDDLNFDDLCQLTYTNKKRRAQKPVPSDPPELDPDMEEVLHETAIKALEEKVCFGKSFDLIQFN